MRAAALVGTRPEIIKMAPLLREARRRGTPLFCLHSGQHWEDAMNRVFFQELELSPPDATLPSPRRGLSSSPRELAARVAEVLVREGIDLLFVQGDTNTALAGALAARSAEIRLVHVEAGLRCFDERMVEERNRRQIDLLADDLFCPTPLQQGFVEREGGGRPGRRVAVVGNTIVDSLHWMLPRLARNKNPKPSIVLTLHRAENAFRSVVRDVLFAAERIAQEFRTEVLWPLHPRLRGLVGLPGRGVRILLAEGYRDFLGRVRDASLVLTDSGGVQEEAAVFGVPCVTLRDTTERQETVERGANMLAGQEPARILEAAREMFGKKIAPHPYGDGRTAQRILDATLSWRRESNDELEALAW